VLDCQKEKHEGEAMVRWGVTALIVMMMSGCSMSWNFWSQNAPKTPQDQKAQNVQIALKPSILMYELDITDRPYKNLGEVSATDTKLNPWGEEPTQANVEAQLKAEAIKVGADALIFVRYTKLGASWNRISGIEGKAQAVKFTRY
jgi:hypothetical protein